MTRLSPTRTKRLLCYLSCKGNTGSGRVHSRALHPAGFCSRRCPPTAGPNSTSRARHRAPKGCPWLLVTSISFREGYVARVISKSGSDFESSECCAREIFPVTPPEAALLLRGRGWPGLLCVAPTRRCCCYRCPVCRQSRRRWRRPRARYGLDGTGKLSGPRGPPHSLRGTAPRLTPGQAPLAFARQGRADLWKGPSRRVPLRYPAPVSRTLWNWGFEWPQWGLRWKS